MNIADNEEIYKYPINLYFGLCIEEKQEHLDKEAIKLGIPFEQALNADFKSIMEFYINSKNNEGRSYFDLIFFLNSEINGVHSPNIKIGSYTHNGLKYPMLTLEDGYLLDKDRIKRFFLRDDVINRVGQAIGEDAEYYFIEYKREL